VSCDFQNRNSVCDQNRKFCVRSKPDSGSEDRAVEENDGLGVGIGGVTQVEDVAVGSQATDDRGARRSGDGQALVTDGDFAVVADTDSGLLTPDIGPPRASGNGAQNGTVFGEGLVASGLGGHPEFTVDFMLVGMGHQLCEQAVGPTQFDDLIGGQESGEAFLPVVVATFDLSFCLGGGRVTEGDAVEVEGGTQLGKGLGVVGVEQGMIIHVEGQRQTVDLEDTGEEIQVS